MTTWHDRATRNCARPVVLAALACAGHLCSMPAQAASGSLVLEDCRIEGYGGMGSVEARCGTLQVAENPAEPQGRRIGLAVAVVPAISRKALPDPLFLLAGGPGQGAQEGFVPALQAFAGIRRERDLVLVDQRGTGKSNRLTCDFDEDAFDEDRGREQYVTLARDCLQKLPGRPEFYTTSIAVKDLEAVRVALGYERINLYGGSYGTRVAQHYIRRYPGSARTVILDAVVHPALALGESMALDGEAALQASFKRCQADAACNHAFPDIAAQFATLRARLQKSPVKVRLNHPVTGVAMEEEVGYGHLALATRMLSYSARTASLFPLLVHEANSHDNLVPLAAQSLLIGENVRDLLAYGMHNSVVCAEDIDFIDDARIDRRALERTYLGKVQYEALLGICSVWPRGPVDEDFKQPLQSAVPALLLSGALDPVTPPAYAAEAAKGFDDHLHVIMQGQGHIQMGLGCVQRLMRQFIDAGTARGLAASDCERQIQPAPFFTTFSGPTP